ncbi:MAG: FkbM family methyltransferase [Acidobacteriota bacterium]|nr:FkbM family methyltransferase [Acidobacteriota bacterium]
MPDAESLLTRSLRGLYMAGRHLHARAAGVVYDLTFPALVRYTRHGGLPALKRALIPALIVPAAATHRPRPFVTTTYFGSQFAGTTGDLIPMAIRLFGVLEENLSYWCEACLAEGDVFVDVGAHLGYFSLLASRLVGPAGRVVAIDASPATFAGLERNVALNPHAANVRAVCAVAAASRGTCPVYRGPEHSTGITSVHPRPLTGNRFEAEVAAAPLAGLLSDDEIRRARLVKIDVEGSEFDVVAGLEPLLDSLRADCEIVVETSEDWQYGGRPARPDDLAGWFRARGFFVYILPKDFIVRRDRARRPQRVDGALHDGYYDLVFSRRNLHAL